MNDDLLAALNTMCEEATYYRMDSWDGDDGCGDCGDACDESGNCCDHCLDAAKAKEHEATRDAIAKILEGLTP